MKPIKIACIQMRCSADRMENIDKAERAVRRAAQQGANLILLPELFERPYFCQERRYEYYEYAEPVRENLAVQHLQKLTAELNVAVPVSLFERDGNAFYNSVAMLDGGKLLGVYRKTHIPDDHYYQEKFYFTPGNTGFLVFSTQFCNVGVGICWDQWFPETARCLALNGADVLLFPTAIGSEPILTVDSAGHWQRVMQGHAAANVMPVVAANRIGTESVIPCAENGYQSSELRFYGSSFLTDATGERIAVASRENEEILYAEYDFAQIRRMRWEWGLFRDRRPDTYSPIIK